MLTKNPSFGHPGRGRFTRNGEAPDQEERDARSRIVRIQSRSRKFPAAQRRVPSLPRTPWDGEAER